MRGLLSKTVWAEDNTANIHSRYRLIYTLLLPLRYALLALYGMFSISVPISSIDLILGGIYGDIWSTAIMISGICALIGIVFYRRLIWLEAVSVILLITLMLLYLGSVLFAAILQVEGFRYLSLLIALIMMPMPCWRVLDIIRELRPVRNVS